MLFALLAGLVLFFAVALFLAWPAAARTALTPTEKILASALLSVLGVFLAAWLVYVTGLSFAFCWLLPAATILGIALNWRTWTNTLRDRDVRGLLITQGIVSAWCLGWAATIASYVGGGWAGDWVEHWERVRFFLERWLVDTPLVGMYSLTARPPLANVVVAAFLALTRPGFANFQLIATLLSTLAFLPAALLARRFGGGARAVAVLGVMFMLNPLFLQNVTFVWTKLPAAFFVLGAWYFFLRAHDEQAPRAAAPLFGATLAAGLITHYSSGPYAVVLGVAWLALGMRAAGRNRRRGATALALAAGTFVLATWFAWSFAVFGLHGTLSANTAVTAARDTVGAQMTTTFLNLRDTLVPHFLRPVDASFIAQPSRWGALHDWWFQLDQLNLFFAFGSVAWLALLVELSRRSRETTPSRRRFWTWLIAATIALGIAVHTPRDTWGLTHICLQPLILLGLAFLASRWIFLGRRWKAVLAAGAVADLALGIVLHFTVQSDATAIALGQYGNYSLMNFGAKLEHRTAFLRDWFTVPFPAAIAILLALLAYAIFRSRKEPAKPAVS
jgi:hypothetical protein